MGQVRLFVTLAITVACVLPEMTLGAAARPAPKPTISLTPPQLAPRAPAPPLRVDACQNPGAIVAAGDSGLSHDASKSLAATFASNKTRVSLADAQAALQRAIDEGASHRVGPVHPSILIAALLMKMEETLAGLPPLPTGPVPDPVVTVADLAEAIGGQLDGLPPVDAPDPLVTVYTAYAIVNDAVRTLLTVDNTPASACNRQQSSPQTLYAHRYDVSEEEADRRLDLQERVPDLEVELTQRMRGFSQAWFDNVAGRWVVALGPAGDVDEARAVLEDLDLAGTEIVRRPFDRAQLQAGLKGLAGRLRDHLLAGRASLGLGNGHLEIHLAKGAPADAKATVRRIAGESAVGTAVIERDDEQFALSPQQRCAHPYCDTLVAGIQWWPENAGQCTAAFYGGSPSDPRPFLLTAGHCIRGGNQRWMTCLPGGTECYWAGTQTANYYGGGGGDGGVVRVDWSTPQFNVWGIYEGWVNWWNQGITTLTHYATENVPNGNWICHQGATTQSSCGEVTRSSRPVEYRNRQTGVVEASLTGMIEVTGACAGLGDSGGPWTMRDHTWAIGIHSGGSLGPNDEPACGGNNISIVEPVHRALSTLNVHLYGRP